MAFKTSSAIVAPGSNYSNTEGHISLDGIQVRPGPFSYPGEQGGHGSAIEHVAWKGGITLPDGTERDTRTSQGRMGFSVAVGGGFVAASCPGDHLNDGIQERGAVYTWDYNGDYIRRYVDLGSYEYYSNTDDVEFGYSIAITDNNELVVTDPAYDDERGAAFKTMMWTYGDNYIHPDLSAGPYTDNSETATSFYQIITPYRYANYSTQYGPTDWGARISYYNYSNFDKNTALSYDIPGTISSNTNLVTEMVRPDYGYRGDPPSSVDGGTIQRPFSISTPDVTPTANGVTNNVAAGCRYGAATAAGCGRVAVIGEDKESGRAFMRLFDEKGMRLRDVETPGDPAQQWGYSRALDNVEGLVSIGSGRIVVGTRGTSFYDGMVYVFDLNGNYLFKITAEMAGYTGFYEDTEIWCLNCAVGCGRIVVSSYPKTSGFRTGQNERVHIFDLNGHYIKSVSRTDAEGGPSRPGNGGTYGQDGVLTNGTKMSPTATGSDFGRALDIGGGIIAIGAPRYEVTYGGDTRDTGAAFILDLDGNPIGGWNSYGACLEIDSFNMPPSAIGASGAGQRYGSSIATADGMVVVGAPYAGANNYGFITITKFDHLGLDLDIETMLKGTRNQAPMRKADSLKHIRVNEFF